MSKIIEYVPGVNGTEEEFIDKHQQLCGQSWKACSSGGLVDLHYYCPSCNTYAIVARNNEQELIRGFLREGK